MRARSDSTYALYAAGALIADAPRATFIFGDGAVEPVCGTIAAPLAAALAREIDRSDHWRLRTVEETIYVVRDHGRT